MTKSNNNPALRPPVGAKPPERLELTAQMEITAADAGDGKAPLPRFSMVAYTGGLMRIAGWRYPMVVDLAGLSIPLTSSNLPSLVSIAQHGKPPPCRHVPCVTCTIGHAYPGLGRPKPTPPAKPLPSSAASRDCPCEAPRGPPQAPWPEAATWPKPPCLRSRCPQSR